MTVFQVIVLGLLGMLHLNGQVNADPCPNATEYVFFYNSSNCEGDPQKYFCGWDTPSPEMSPSRTRTRNLMGTAFRSIRYLGSYRFTIWEKEKAKYHYIYRFGFPPKGSGCIEHKDFVPDIPNGYLNTQPHSFFHGLDNYSQLFFMNETGYQGKFIWVPHLWNSDHHQPPFQARSYIHVSNETWLIYGNNDYSSSKPICLLPTINLAEGKVVTIPWDGVIGHPNVNIRVGSVRKDTTGICNGGKMLKIYKENYLFLILSLLALY